jgi:hypothetical protein
MRRGDTSTVTPAAGSTCTTADLKQTAELVTTLLAHWLEP